MSTKQNDSLFSEMIKSFDNEYRKFYLTKFRNVDFNDTELKNDFLVINCIPFLSFRSGEQGNAVRSKSQELQCGKALRVC